MKTLVMSCLYPCFCEELAARGYHILPTKSVDIFHRPERLHVDMQLLKIEDRLFTLNDCLQPLGRNYPDNVRLNCLYFGNRLYAKLSAADESVLAFCRERNIELINVRQGYTRCSTLVIAENAVVTADKTIEKALRRSGAEVLLIEAGDIRLEGFSYGFIGGAGFADNGVTYFFGDITKHPDYGRIEAFCRKHHSKIEIVCKKEPLTDIGGVVIL